MSVETQPTVGSIHRYPVKSMLGEDLESCPIDRRGLVGDRAYALIDADDGKVASAKNPRKWGGLLGFHAAFDGEPVLGERPPPVTITLPDGSDVRSDDGDVDARLSAAIGRQVRLVSVAPEKPTFEEVWPEIENLAPADFIASTTIGHDADGEAVSEISLGMAAPPGTFFDLAVLHLLTTSTLATLQAAAPDATFDSRRYRPNLLIESCAGGFVEDGWIGGTLRIGSTMEASITFPTMRCVMTTLPQGELPVDRRTLRTIAEQNRREIPGFGTWACAGVYADVVASGVVRIGDIVEFNEKR